jgi:hypothetical protein
VKDALYPTRLHRNVYVPGETSRENFPCTSVDVPVAVPSIRILAQVRGSFVEPSRTMPLMVYLSAAEQTSEDTHMKMMDEITER